MSVEVFLWTALAITFAAAVACAIAAARSVQRVHAHDPEIVEVRTTRQPFTKSDRTGQELGAEYEPVYSQRVPMLKAQPTDPVRTDIIKLRCKTCGEVWEEPYSDFWEELAG